MLQHHHHSDSEQNNQMRRYRRLHHGGHSSHHYYGHVRRHHAAQVHKPKPELPHIVRNVDTKASRHDLNLGDKELYHLAAIAQAEGGCDGTAGMQAVAAVVKNRLAAGGFGSSVENIISAENQFEPVAKYGGIDKLPKPTKEAMAAVLDVVSGRIADPTHGATFFLNPKVTKERGTYFGHPSTKVADIGQQEFHDGYTHEDPKAKAIVTDKYHVPSNVGVHYTGHNRAYAQAFANGAQRPQLAQNTSGQGGAPAYAGAPDVVSSTAGVSAIKKATHAARSKQPSAGAVLADTLNVPSRVGFGLGGPGAM